MLVSREQIARNYRNVRSVVGPGVEVAGVVKADAYGHGALEVSRVLLAEGARWLAVSSVEEGVQLRAGGIRDARILVMGGFLPYEGDAVVENNLTPAVHSLAQIRDVDRLAAAAGKPIRLPPEDRFRHGAAGHARQRRGDPRHAGARRRHARLEGLMTHFASAADYTVAADRRASRRISTASASDLRAAGIRAPYLHTSSTIAIGYGRTRRIGTRWCAPGTRSTGTFRRRAATPRGNCSTSSRRSPGRPSCWP